MSPFQGASSLRCISLRACARSYCLSPLRGEHMSPQGRYIASGRHLSLLREYLPLDMAIAPFRGFPLSPDADGAALGKARACSTVAVRTCRYRWMRAEPPWAKARTCSIVAMVVSPGNVVSNAPCAHPSFTASAGSSPDSSP